MLGWVRRYGLAEIAGTSLAIISSIVVGRLADNDVAAAYAGVFGENVGFYGVIVAREIAAARARAAANGRRFTRGDALSIATGLMIEFGPAELLDSTLVRPVAMGLGIRWLGDAVGVIAGKLAADVLFYIPAILIYEYRSRRAGE